MSRTFKNIKGTFDILPDPSNSKDASPFSSFAWLRVESVIREIMERHGMSEIRTPILEPLDLVARGVGELTDIVSKEMFAFSREGTDYVLRPEITAPVVRSYMQHNLNQQGGVQQLYYIGPCFRAERPQKGRYRQFHQFGAEVIGEEGPMADAQTILCMVDIYRELGIENVTLRLNSLGDEKSRPAYKNALTEYLTPLADQLGATSISRLENNVLRILDTKNPDERKLLEGAPVLSDFIDDESKKHFESVCSILEQTGLHYSLDPFLVRGLDYYTRTAFELESPDLGAQNALAGGGRYDLLATDLGSKKKIPAVGFAAGMERLLLAIDETGKPVPEPEGPVLNFIALGSAALEWVNIAASDLRRAGISVICPLSERSLKAQMRDANKRSARFAVIVGDDELEQRKASVKNLKEGTQDSVAFDDLQRFCTENI